LIEPRYAELLEQLPPVRYVVSLSSGASSAVAADRAIQRFGKHSVDLVFADTLWEDEDNYRFLRDLSARWQMPELVLTDGRNPLQVAEDEHIIPNQKIAPCTEELKIKQFLDYLKLVQAEGDRPVALLGMSWHERDRTKAPRRNYAKIGVWTDYPLLWQPMIADPIAEVRSWGIEPPRMYAMGYRHANCGGRCVKQGARDWKITLQHFPERFAESEAWEAKMREDERFKDYAFLRDSTGGTVKAKTLRQLREQVESADERQMKLFAFEDDLTFGCTVECGVGDPGTLIA
jgi:hypothetical protein